MYTDYLKVSPTTPCDTNHECIAGVDSYDSTRWQPVGSGGAANGLAVMLYSVDDNTVGLAKTKWELRVPLRIQTVADVNIVEDDKMHLGLKRRDYNDNGHGWIEVSGSEGTLPTTAMVQVCYQGAPDPNAGDKISNHATATFPLRLSCTSWWTIHGGAGQSSPNHANNAGWESLWISGPAQIFDAGNDKLKPYHPRVCNCDYLYLWEALGPQTTQVKYNVGETMTTATVTYEWLQGIVAVHIGPSYRTECLI